MASSTKTPSIGESLQSLPPELFNEIYDLTFTADKNGVVDLDNTSPFPQLLHIDRISRETFAESYYSSTRFTFNLRGDSHPPVFIKWYHRLPAQHQLLLAEVIAKIDELTTDKPEWSQRATCEKQCAYANLASFKHFLDTAGEMYLLKTIFRVQL